MHQTRQETSIKFPINRKGTKYIAHALSNVNDSVPVVIAVRDILKLAKTAREVKEMIKEKLLKINGRDVKDYRESISLFNIFEADKHYALTILPTKKFSLEPTSLKNERLCKVSNKQLLKNSKIQFGLHDGSNVITKEKISVGDSVYLDFSGKIKKHISLEKGKEIFVFSGKYTGLKGNVKEIKEKKVLIKFKDKEELVKLNQSQIIAL